MDLRVLGIGLALALCSTGQADALSSAAYKPSIHESIEDALAAGRAQDAADLIARASTMEASPRVDIEKAEYALLTGDLDAAVSAFQALTNDKDQSGRAYQGLGLTWLRKGDPVQAITAFDKALALSPDAVRALVGRGVAADQTKDWSRAEACYGRALELEPASAAALTNRGYSRLLRGRNVDAIADLRRAVAIAPRSSAARTDLQLALAASGDYKAAFAGSTKVTIAHDLNTVGFAAMSRGDYALAETYFTRAMELNPEFDRTAWANLIYVKQLTHGSISRSERPR